MFRPGLVSVTFRGLSAEQVIEVARKAGLEGIEWGGDIHVPHGDVARAREVGELTRKAGLTVSSYGSYYEFHECFAERSGPSGGSHDDSASPTIRQVIDTTVALGAPVARVWAGRKGSRDASSEERAALVARAREAGAEAAAKGIRLAFEYHPNTLTDTGASAVRLVREVDHPAVRSLWQPPTDIDHEKQVQGLRAIFPYLDHMHCYYWGRSGTAGRPALADGASEWRDFLRVAAVEAKATDRGDIWVLLEFVDGDLPENLYRDARTLRELIAEINP